MALGTSAWRPQTLYNDLRHFFRICGESSTVSRAYRMLMLVNLALR